MGLAEDTESRSGLLQLWTAYVTAPNLGLCISKSPQSGGTACSPLLRWRGSWTHVLQA